MTDTKINIKATISIAEFKAIVDFVVDKCFDEVGDYDPTYRDFWENYCVLIYYTDYPLYSASEHDINEIFEQIYSDECTKVLREVVNKTHSQYLSMNTAIDARIQHRLNCQYKAAAYSMTDMAISSLVDKLSGILDDFSSNFDEDTIKSFTDMANKLSDLKIPTQENVVKTIYNIKKQEKNGNNIEVSSKEGE